jgi:hypothetical protein
MFAAVLYSVYYHSSMSLCRCTDRNWPRWNVCWVQMTGGDACGNSPGTCGSIVPVFVTILWWRLLLPLPTRSYR